MKKIAILLIILGCIGFARTRSESWSVVNKTGVTANQTLTAPYLNSGITIISKVASINVYLTQSPVADSLNIVTIVPNTYQDFYPLNFEKGKIVIAKPVITGDIQVIWYNNKE